MLYLDGFLIFLTAKVLAPGSCALNPPHGLMGIAACERPRAPCPEQGHAKSIPRACPHSVCVPGCSGVRAWQGEGVGAPRSPRARCWALGERRGFVSTLPSLKAPLQRSASIWPTGDPANGGFGRPARSSDRQEGAAEAVGFSEYWALQSISVRGRRMDATLYPWSPSPSGATGTRHSSDQ